MTLGDDEYDDDDTIQNVWDPLPSTIHPQVSPFIPLLLDYNPEEGLTLDQMQNFLFLDREGMKLYILFVS